MSNDFEMNRQEGAAGQSFDYDREDSRIVVVRKDRETGRMISTDFSVLELSKNRIVIALDGDNRVT
jgi:hypothetical protein